MQRSYTMSRRKSSESRRAILIRVRSSAGRAPEGICAALRPMGSHSEPGKTGGDQAVAEASDPVSAPGQSASCLSQLSEHYSQSMHMIADRGDPHQFVE